MTDDRPRPAKESGSRRLLVSTMLIGAFTLTSVGVAAQEEPEYDLPGVMAEFWASQAGREFIAEYTVSPAQTGANLVSDPVADFEYSSGEPPGLTNPPGNIDITDGSVFGFDPPPGPNPFFDRVENGGVFCEPDPLSPLIPGVTTICPDQGFNPGAFDGGAVVTVIEVAQPFGLFDLSKTCEWVIWLRRPDSPVFEAMPQYPLDPAANTNRAFGLRTGPDEFGAFRLDLTDNGFFQQMPTDTLIAIGENQIAFFTPRSEIGDVDGGRAYTFCTEGTYSADDSAADSTGFFDIVVDGRTLDLAAPTPSTTTGATTTTAPPTTTAPASTTSSAATTSSGSGSTPGILVALGGMAVIAGVWMLSRKKPCDDLLAAWKAAERRHRMTNDALQEAQATLDQRRARTAELEAELARLEAASAMGEVTEGGVAYKLLPGEGRVTAEGLESIIDSTRSQLDSARTAEADAEGSVEHWKTEMNRTAAEAEAARMAYEECIAAATPPPPTQGPGRQPGTGGPAIATTPDQSSGCPEGSREARPIGSPQRFRICRAFRVETETEGGAAMAGSGETMVADLRELAAGLGVLGALLGAKGAGEASARGITSLAGGKVVAGVGGLVEGGVGGLLAAKGNLGTSDFPVPVPTSGPEVVAGTLQLIAQLAALVAGKAVEWTERRQLVNYRLVREYQPVTVTPYQIWVCDGQTWRCAQTVLEYEVGAVQTLRSNPVSGRATSDLDRERLQRELERMVAIGRSSMESSLRQLQEFEEANRPGPCR